MTTHIERETALEACDELTDRVRREPLKAVGLVFGMGALIGLGLGLGFASGLSRGSALGPGTERGRKMGALARGSLALALLLMTVVVAGETAVSTPRQYQYDVVTVTLPKGEPEQGRRAFRDLKCYVCHRVAGETSFPQPASDAQGPDLDRSLSLRPASDIAAAIILPSHSMSIRTSAALKTRLKDLQLSPMGDFSETLTVRQLADLLTYLGSLQTPRR